MDKVFSGKDGRPSSRMPDSLLQVDHNIFSGKVRFQVLRKAEVILRKSQGLLQGDQKFLRSSPGRPKIFFAKVRFYFLRKAEVTLRKDQGCLQED